jgi:hypothetical protein
MRSERYHDIQFPANHFANDVRYKDAFKRWDYVYFWTVFSAFLPKVALLPALLAASHLLRRRYIAAISHAGLTLTYLALWLRLPRRQTLMQDKADALFKLKTILKLQADYEEITLNQHRKALQILGSDANFCLMLRTFALEADESRGGLGEMAWAREYDLQNASQLVMVNVGDNTNTKYYSILNACLPTIMVAQPILSSNHVLNMNTAELHLTNHEWQNVVTRLIEDASAVVLVVSALSVGVMQELELIRRARKENRTIAILVASHLSDETTRDYWRLTRELWGHNVRSAESTSTIGELKAALEKAALGITILPGTDVTEERICELIGRW